MPLWPAGSGAVRAAGGEGGVARDCSASSGAPRASRGGPRRAHVCGRAVAGLDRVFVYPLFPPPSPSGTGGHFPAWVAMERALRSLARRALGLPSTARSRSFGEGPTRDQQPSRLCTAAARGGDGARTFRGGLHAAREGWGSAGREASKGRRRPEGRALPIERTRGSEILFGVAPCSMALSQARRDLFRLFLKRSGGPQRLVTSEFVLQAAARGVPVLHVGRRELDTLCGGRVHQGVCLEATPLRFKRLEEAEEPGLGDGESPNRQLLWLALEQIQDPMNLGALLRSAYFLGVDRVVTSQRNRYGVGCSLLQCLGFLFSFPWWSLTTLLNSSFRGLSETDLEMCGWAELGSRGCGMQRSRLAGNLFGCSFLKPIPCFNCLIAHTVLQPVSWVCF